MDYDEFARMVAFDFGHPDDQVIPPVVAGEPMAPITASFIVRYRKLFPYLQVRLGEAELECAKDEVAKGLWEVLLEAEDYF